MNEKRKCLVGHDSDDGAMFAIIMAVIMAVIVVMIIVAIIVYGGAFIGGFYSLKNYFVSFKHNVYDSNRNPVSAA